MDTTPGRSCDTEVRVTRQEVFVMLKNRLQSNFSDILQHLEEQLSKKFGCSILITEHEMKSALHALLNKMRSKWQSVKRTEQKFFKKFEDWLNVSIAFRVPAAIPINTKTKIGRPVLEFSSVSERTKRRKTEDMRTNYTIDVLSYATQMSLRAEGKLNASKIVKEVTCGNPSIAARYRRAIESKSETTLSGDAAFSVLIEQKLSKRQYLGLTAISKENNCNLYPPYKTILEAKDQSYPTKSDIIITEYSAEVNIQSLLNQTVKRILLYQNDVIKSLASEDVRHMVLICKWGCDGSSGQSVYKQAFSDGNKSDSDIFLSSLVPLQLLSDNNRSATQLVIWKNPRPSSPRSRFCRPIRLQFLHENTESTLQEVLHIEKQIKALIPLVIIIDGKEISVTYELGLAMIDGKVCHAVSSTSSAQRCHLCKATSKQFNEIDKVVQREINEDHLRFGLSTLHAWIRFFECCLHLSYKLDIKKWQARSKEDKEMVKNCKVIIQKGFRLQLGLIVDHPKPGCGSSNDGNTARRFFENFAVSASITGVSENLIKRFHVILQVISSGHTINNIKFEEYAMETARQFVHLYPWYYMSTSVHKLLIHGPQIIEAALLPIGQMSEDAQEALNKSIKRFREDFSRKCSRIKTMEDVFSRLMIASDPYISSIRKLPTKKMRNLSPETVNLLLQPSINAVIDTDDWSEIDILSDDDSDSSEENSDTEISFS